MTKNYKDWWQGSHGEQLEKKEPHSHHICGKCQGCKTCKICRCKKEKKLLEQNHTLLAENKYLKRGQKLTKKTKIKYIYKTITPPNRTIIEEIKTYKNTRIVAITPNKDGQYTIRIPTKFGRITKLQLGDKFKIELYKKENNTYGIRGELQ